MIVAHRGASADAPENTVAAFKLAWEQGADAVEGDFRLTSDGQIVCAHDDNMKRVSGTGMVVRDATLAALRTLDVGVRYGEAYGGTVVPTIAEVFATIPEHGKIFIEIKCGKEIIAPLLEAIRKAELSAEQIVVICFKKGVIRELKARAPGCKALWISDFKKGRSGRTTPSVETVLATLKELRADGFSSSTDVPDEGFIKRVKSEGYEYHVWTVDDPEDARRLEQWGVDSITTNRPGDIRKALR
jgi:glycerophosphoryl diester phosphodiesterase